MSEETTQSSESEATTLGGSRETLLLQQNELASVVGDNVNEEGSSGEEHEDYGLEGIDGDVPKIDSRGRARRRKRRRKPHLDKEDQRNDPQASRHLQEEVEGGKRENLEERNKNKAAASNPQPLSSSSSSSNHREQWNAEQRNNKSQGHRRTPATAAAASPSSHQRLSSSDALKRNRTPLQKRATEEDPTTAVTARSLSSSPAATTSAKIVPFPRKGSLKGGSTTSISAAAKSIFQDRRGSLKSFAASILDRKGSFRKSTLGKQSKRAQPGSLRLLPSSSTLTQNEVSSVISGHNQRSWSLPVSPVEKVAPRQSQVPALNNESPADVVNALTSSGITSQLKAKLRGELNNSNSSSNSATPILPRRRMSGDTVTKSGSFMSSSSWRGSRPFIGLSSSESGLDLATDNSLGSNHNSNLVDLKQVDFDREYDIVQKIGEGWFSRVYLTEHRETREELVLKAINSKTVSEEDFLREFRYSRSLATHPSILKVFDIVFQSNGQYMFATEYASLGDLTSNISDSGLGEACTKRVARQIGSALEFMHSKNLCHLDVKLDNILVFKSDFSRVKLCDFGSVKSQGDIVIKKNEHLPYCPPELMVKNANEYYHVDRVQDVFQFGIVIFFCLFAILPWQRADVTDPNFAEFVAWRTKKSSKPAKNFKPMTSRGQKLFRKLMDVDPSKRLKLNDLTKYTEDKWLKKPGGRLQLLQGSPANTDPKGISDGISQLTMGSFQSVHSNAVEKNRILYTLLQHGVETTVDRSKKNSRIINWIQQGHKQEENNVIANEEEEELCQNDF